MLYFYCLILIILSIVQFQNGINIKTNKKKNENILY